MMKPVSIVTAIAVLGIIWALPSAQADDSSALEKANPLKPLPDPPLGINSTWDEVETPPTPETVRLGRWLFFDKRLSADNTVSCASCHRPENAFSEPTPVSTGIRGQKGGRKSPSFLNQAWTLYPHFFWDGRAGSLEEQALGPIANPIEMGNTLDNMVSTLKSISQYGPYFAEAFGTPEVTQERVGQAIAAYERTRMSGNSPWDRWRQKRDESAVSAEVKLGHELFHNKAACNQCHLGQNLTDTLFHNLGVGWEPTKNAFKDIGRFEISKKEEDKGAFKTPGLRDLKHRGPYMHDGSMETLREVVELYNKGGEKNPQLSPKLKPLNLTADEVDALLAFMDALNGEGYQDTIPAAFPQ